MALLICSLALAVALAVLIAVVAALPHHRQSIPHAEQLSSVLTKVNDKLGL